MTLAETIEKLVQANHILAREGVNDAFGHVSARHPERRDRFLISCSRAPEQVAHADIMEVTMDGTVVDAAGRKPYNERFIHSAIFAARPDVQSIVHNHSYAVIPFAASRTPLRPMFHVAGMIGAHIPV